MGIKLLQTALHTGQIAKQIISCAAIIAVHLLR
jgi:hypothetical protein